MAKSRSLTVVKQQRQIVDRLAEDMDYRASVQEALELENIRQDRDKAVRGAINSAFYAGIRYAVDHAITRDQLDAMDE